MGMSVRRFMRRLPGVVAGMVVVMALGQVASAAGKPSHPRGQTRSHSGGVKRSHAVGHLKHVFVIVLENHSKAGVIGDPNTPQITALADHFGVAGQYFGVTHPSEPNYVAMIAGDNFGINNDSPSNRFDATNLVDQLQARGYTWGAYMESMPTAGYLGDFWPSSSDPLYASKHNPFVLFND